MDVAELIGLQAGFAPRAALARGGELEREGAVQLVRFGPLVVIAEVDDAAACVHFQLVDGALRWCCTCDPGRDGAFCAHCVATAWSIGRRTARPVGREGVRPAAVGTDQSAGSRTERKASPGVSSVTASTSTARIAS